MNTNEMDELMACGCKIMQLRSSLTKNRKHKNFDTETFME